jgi:hypothetical protein
MLTQEAEAAAAVREEKKNMKSPLLLLLLGPQKERQRNPCVMSCVMS